VGENEKRELEEEGIEKNKAKSTYKGKYLADLLEQSKRRRIELKKRQLKELCSTIDELIMLQEEKQEAGQGVWYEVVVYIGARGVEYQIARHNEAADAASQLAHSPTMAKQFIACLRISYMHLLIGHHVSIAKSIDLAFDRASMLGYTAMQIFTSNPRQWHARPLKSEETKRFAEKAIAYHIEAVAHMPYLANLASSNKGIAKQSESMLAEQVARCEALGISKLVVHLGSNSEKRQGIENAAEAINQAERRQVSIIMENQAGQLNSIGSKIDDLAEVYDKVSGRKGICIDTCHAFAAGYSVDAELAETVNELGAKSRVIHMNDAMYNRGSGRDRHENIGFGKIGAKAFEDFFSGFAQSELEQIPIILETPTSKKISEKDEFELAKRIVAKAMETGKR